MFLQLPANLTVQYAIYYRRVLTVGKDLSRPKNSRPDPGCAFGDFRVALDCEEPGNLMELCGGC
jgi:hypothetical protein